MVDKTGDAIALWQQMVGEMQKSFRTFGNQFSQGTGNALEPRDANSGSPQKPLADLMESYFAGMNMPSRTQLTALSDRLQAIENELVEIKMLLHKALIPKPVQEAPAAPMPPKSKSRPVPAGKKAPMVPKGDNKP